MILAIQWCYFRGFQSEVNVRMWEPHVKKPKKWRRSALLNLGWRGPCNVEIDNSIVLFLCIPKQEKCENLMKTKPKSGEFEMKAIPQVKFILVIQCWYFRVFQSDRNLRTLCKQSQSESKHICTHVEDYSKWISSGKFNDANFVFLKSR